MRSVWILFNTNLLAQRAGIRVRTVYRYFPNKFAVLAELARRNTARAVEAVDKFATLADANVPLQQGLDILWSNYLSQLAGIPGIAAVRHACRVCPELESIRHEFHSKLSKQLETAIKKRGVQLKPAQRRLIAALFIETTSAILDYAETVDRKRRLDLLRELQIMQYRYLAPYFS
ncbi:MAG: TetR/AcrR family transcriptional regulator [Gammaproteobacteria bacterium]|nr:TetR/AcrR family transcriptional regulator [Gammaproteobacteria bacterium]